MKFFQYILLATLFLLTNAVFAQDESYFRGNSLEIITKKGKQGVYNTQTKRFVIKPVYDEIHITYFEDLGFWFRNVFDCSIGNKKLSLVVDLREKVTYEYDESSNLFEFLILNNKQKKKGIYNAWKSKTIAKPIYDSIFFISWSLYHAINGINFKDNYGGCVVYNEIDFEAKRRQSEMYAIMIKGNKFVALNLKKEAIDSVSTLFYFKDIENIYGTGYQLIDLKGENYIFDSSFLLKNKFQVFCPKNDKIKKGNKYGLMNRQGNVYMPVEFDSIQRIKNYYLCFKNNNVSYAKTTLLNYGDSIWFKIDTIKIGHNGVQQVVGFDEDVFTIKINDKWKFRYFKDSFEYDSIYKIDRKVLLKKDGKWSLNFIKDYNERRKISRYPTPYYKNKKKAIRKEKRKNIELFKVIKQQPCCGYEYQTHFLWDSIAILNGDNYWHVAKQNNKILILNGGGYTLIKLKENKVNKIGFEKIQYQYKYFSAERIDWEYKVIKKENRGEKEFVYVLVNKKPLFKKPYQAKRYLQNGKLVKQPTFKKSIYAEIKNYLSAHKRARKENRKLKEK